MNLTGKPDVQTALKALRPDTPNWYNWATHDAEGNKIPNDQRMCWEHAIVIQEGVTKPTKAEFDAKLAELEAEYNAKDYARKRVFEYPSLADFADAYYWAQNGDDTKMTAYIEKCAEVKQKYPKS